MHGLLTGAGFSKWAADLPVAAGLFDFAIEPFGPRESVRLDRVRRAKALWDKLNPDSPAELFVSQAVDVGGDHTRDVLWYITRRLAEPYIWIEHHAGRQRRHVLSIDELRVHPRPGVGQVSAFIRQMRGLDLAGIVTTNYDMLIEYALSSRGFHYGRIGETLTGRGPYPLATAKHPTRLSGRIRYSKLHGSISWRDDGRYTDGRGALTGGALIVPPVPGKQSPESLGGIWEGAERTLRRSDELVVFGFAFNPYDIQVLGLLRRGGNRLKRVLLIDPNPPIERAASLWPEAAIDVLPPTQSAEVTSWLQQGAATASV